MRTGRPTIYTEELCDAILAGLRDGLTRETAAEVNVSRTTFYRWIEERPDFRDAVEKAEAEFTAWAHREIKNAEGGQGATPWTSRAWLLERRRAHEYKLETGVKHSGSVELGLGDLIRASRAPNLSTGDAIAKPTDNISEPT